MCIINNKHTFVNNKREIMSLFDDIYNDIRSVVDWDIVGANPTATFGNSEITFTESDGVWIVNPVVSESEKNLTSTIKDLMITFISKHSPTKVLVESEDASTRNTFEYVFDAVGGMYNYSMIADGHTLELEQQVEYLQEEPNSSLMYHRMFPNKRLNAELESYGYTFRDGSGMKLMRKTMGSTNRNSRPHERRTMQSVIIFKDGRIFRKIAKQKWNQLVDPSDKDSETWGVAFQRKIVASERKQRTQQGIEIHFK